MNTFSIDTLCGAPHNVSNAESIFMRTPHSTEAIRLLF